MAKLSIDKKIASKKIKKFEFVIVPIQIKPIKPITGIIALTIAWVKCFRLFKSNAYGYVFYRFSIPKLERWVE
jgi:hypothetical protein